MLVKKESGPFKVYYMHIYHMYMYMFLLMHRSMHMCMCEQKVLWDYAVLV